MAKIKGLLSGATGKLQDGVIYESGGNTIFRKKTKAVDRKSNLQKVQRVIMNTVFAQYRAFKHLANHSFEGVSYGAKSMQTFTKKNAEALRDRASEVQNAGQSLYDLYQFIPVGSSKFTPAAIILSMGQLNEIKAQLTPGASAKGMLPLPASGAITYADIAQATGARRGDQLTFVTVEKDGTGAYKVNYCRVVLDPRTAGGSQIALADSPFIEEGHVANPNPRNQGSFSHLATNGYTLEFNIAGLPVAAVGIIASRQYNKEWLRSNCKLVLSEDVLGSDKMSLMDCVESYGQSTAIDVESEFYLNNAGIGGAVADAGNGGGSNTPVVDPTAPTVSNNVIFMDYNTEQTVTQNVSGGSTSVNGPIGMVQVTGANLTDGYVKVGTTNDISAASDLEADEEDASNASKTFISPIQNGSTLYFWKNGTLWFTCAVVAAGGGGGNGDE